MDRCRGKILRARPRLLLGLAIVVVVSAPGAHAATTPGNRVLILDSFAHNFAPYNTLIADFKSETARHSPGPLEFHELPLEVGGSNEPQAEGAFVAYIRALFAARRLDLVVPVGGPALRFWQRHRDELFPTAPTLFAGIDQRHLQNVTLSTNQTAVSLRLDLPGAVEDILRLLPETAEIEVVLGDSPLERFWVGEAKREWQSFNARVRFNWWNTFSFEEIRQRAAVLPPRSVILYMMMSVDARGVPHQDERALAVLHSEAKAPIFGLFGTQLGRGIMGGRLVDVTEVGRATAGVALRILAGEQPVSIRTPPLGPAAPIYDWRELRRWSVGAASLPPGSVVLQRFPTGWEKHRWKFLGAIGIFGLQGLALAGLLVQRNRRRRAELESQERRRELLHATRVSTVGELTASLAHELHQPLGAILRNAEAAELLLQRSPPDLDELQSILADIRQDDARAALVIDHLRGLLKRHDLESQPLAVGDLFDEVRRLVHGEAAFRGVELEMEAPADLPHIRGDRVHLVQVLLNLVVNAMDACNGGRNGTPGVSVRAQHLDGVIEVSVSDTGHGIPSGDLERVFEPFHSTKVNGLGLGLSISRTIIEAHGGRVWASNHERRGATFRFTLPAAGGRG